MTDPPYLGDEAWDDPDHLDDLWTFDGTLFQFSPDDGTPEIDQGDSL